MISRFTRYLAFAALFAAFILSAGVFSYSGEVWEKFIDQTLGGKPLPEITSVYLVCANSGWSMPVGFILAILSVLILMALERSPRTSPYLPFALTVGWILAFLPMAIALFAVTCPFIPWISPMR